jgi:hypothetical protein
MLCHGEIVALVRIRLGMGMCRSVEIWVIADQPTSDQDQDAGAYESDF